MLFAWHGVMQLWLLQVRIASYPTVYTAFIIAGIWREAKSADNFFEGSTLT